MLYITIRQPPRFHQMSLEEFLFSNKNYYSCQETASTTNTRTYEANTLSKRFLSLKDISALILKLIDFNKSVVDLLSVPRETLYHTFYIPKSKGGLRRIDAPVPKLMEALRNLKEIFENDFGALYHTSAFAYIKGRCTIDAVKRHQYNESKWFAKYDLSDFFGSTTLDYAMKMFSMIFPFSEVVKYPTGYEELKKALSLAFLNGGLPQGTPISPLITNIIMIPVDFNLSRKLRNYNRQNFIYTRYADDFLISSKYDFDFREIEKVIEDTLAEFGAPFRIKPSKTRYGSSSGQNWNLGVMLNSENKITIGHKKKRQFEAMLASYVMDKLNGRSWSISDVQVMDGYRNYYTMVEGDVIGRIVSHIGEKFNVNIPRMIKNDLRTL